MTMHNPVHANAKMTMETEILALRRRLAKAHRILTAGGIWPITKGHVSARIPGTDKVLILGHIHSEGRSLIDTDVDDIVTVSEEAIASAMRTIWETMKIVIEPSAAVPYAAIQESKIDVGGKNVGIILTGGNVDLDSLPW